MLAEFATRDFDASLTPRRLRSSENAKDETVCRFERRGGLYVAKLDLKDPRIGLDKPGLFGRPDP